MEQGPLLLQAPRSVHTNLVWAAGLRLVGHRRHSATTRPGSHAGRIGVRDCGRLALGRARLWVSALGLRGAPHSKRRAGRACCALNGLCCCPASFLAGRSSPGLRAFCADSCCLVTVTDGHHIVNRQTTAMCIGARTTERCSGKRSGARRHAQKANRCMGRGSLGRRSPGGVGGGKCSGTEFKKNANVGNPK